MNADFLLKQTTRREMLRNSAGVVGGGFLAKLFPTALLHAAAPAFAQQATAPAGDAVAAFRARMAAVPIQTQKISDNLTLLTGPGGNVVVLDGKDGKFVVDTFVAPVWAKLKETLDGMGSAPVKFVINTHWHFDHTDNNAPLHAAGAKIVAHENTKKRMSETHDLPVLGLHFPPSPAEALPEQTFGANRKLHGNGESMMVQHLAPAHTDTDVYVHFEKGNVLHMGDTYFHGIYPYIDSSTGGNMSGMVAALEKGAALADDHTKIVPGHGPLGDKADVKRFREMLVTVQGRLQKLKAAGKSAEEAAAEKPLADLDAVWGKGFFNSDQFVQIAYLAL